MTRIHRDFVYDGDATSVSTPGVPRLCQAARRLPGFRPYHDLRSQGPGPARRLRQRLSAHPPAAGRPRLEGADATHAWVSLWCGDDIGWIGFDPTNAILAAESHIVLATGRDYADVAPIDGILLSPGDQELKVAVGRGAGGGVRRGAIGVDEADVPDGRPWIRG